MGHLQIDKDDRSLTPAVGSSCTVSGDGLIWSAMTAGSSCASSRDRPYMLPTKKIMTGLSHWQGGWAYCANDDNNDRTSSGEILRRQ